MSQLCVVFGGSRGIGRAVAALLAEKGQRVVVVSRNLDAARAAAASLPGADHVGLNCDVSSELDVQRTFEQILRECGNVDYLVNASGINRDALLARTRPEDMVSILHTNLLGTMLTCRASLRSMIQNRGGAIVNIGSVVGLKGNVGQTVYSASKAGLQGFTLSLAKEVAPRNIRVNLVAPGLIRTDMTAALDEDVLKGAVPLGRFGEPREVAHAVHFLLETPYVTGQVLLVDGGLRLAS
ncbi:carbonyl reductase family member 4 isoform X1 [Brienomyrus brachyistius]|uniref:carbonyl reductase family member 4 isoform X1 n=1 Tax=Brienomyrus brachyistius TaxID=42636 RepID=UPI0020B1F587|nr:carbonyl reductase family member 4 isoform X1 [Brienomyrus brachyistius]XP_048866663.1 carbonyl reductase family member 4 isoform X1 [Brienomyrus brachyistius]XP_048866673.1 carbonyl reductase family member 4 isoform X1 [Brienomyrus brachyistius]